MTLLVTDTMDEEKEVKKQKNRQEELTRVKEGDILDLRKLLFTKDRDYLIRNDGNQVYVHVCINELVYILRTQFLNSVSSFL